MKEIRSNKKNLFSKIFIKLCRIFGFEIIDQSNFSIPTSGKSLNDSISISGKRSVTLPLGKVEITRSVKSLDVILRTCMSVNMLTQSKKRLFEKNKEEYTMLSLLRKPIGISIYATLALTISFSHLSASSKISIAVSGRNLDVM